MARAKKNNIFVNDSFLVQYRCWKNRETQQARTQFGGTEANLARDPIIPVAATIRLVNFEINEEVPLGDDGETEVIATIDGNKISYLIGGEYFSLAGSYRVYTRIFITDERIMTEVLQFRVNAIT